MSGPFDSSPAAMFGHAYDRLWIHEPGLKEHQDDLAVTCFYCTSEHSFRKGAGENRRASAKQMENAEPHRLVKAHEFHDRLDRNLCKSSEVIRERPEKLWNKFVVSIGNEGGFFESVFGAG